MRRENEDDLKQFFRCGGDPRAPGPGGIEPAAGAFRSIRSGRSRRTIERWMPMPGCAWRVRSRSGSGGRSHFFGSLGLPEPETGRRIDRQRIRTLERSPSMGRSRPISRLRDEGIRVAVVSNSDGSVRESLSRAGFDGLFEFVWTVTRSGSPSPTLRSSFMPWDGSGRPFGGLVRGRFDLSRRRRGNRRRVGGVRADRSLGPDPGALAPDRVGSPAS